MQKRWSMGIYGTYATHPTVSKVFGLVRSVGNFTPKTPGAGVGRNGVVGQFQFLGIIASGWWRIWPAMETVLVWRFWTPAMDVYVPSAQKEPPIQKYEFLPLLKNLCLDVHRHATRQHLNIEHICPKLFKIVSQLQYYSFSVPWHMYRRVYIYIHHYIIYTHIFPIVSH